MTYTCKYKLYHDKPVISGEPSSNNGWIYTAYAKALELPIANYDHYFFLQRKCFVNDRYAFIRSRLPDLKEPPISRDEIIGMHVLKTNIDTYLSYHKWHLTKESYNDISLLESLKALWSIRNEHRNYVWKNEVFAAYKLAFKLMPHDRYFIKKTSPCYTPNIYEWLAFQFYALITIIKKDYSARNILWLQLKEIGSVFWIKFINQKKNFKKYFPLDHPFSL